MSHNPLGKSIVDLFPISVEDYPENMRAGIEALRRREMRGRFFQRTLIAGSWISRGILVLIASSVLAMAIDRRAPSEYDVTIKTPEVHAGDKLKMSVTADRGRLCEMKVTFHAYDGEGSPKIVELPWNMPAGHLGRDLPFTRALTVPTDATPGPSRLRIEREYRCPLNLVHMIWPIDQISGDYPFTILPRVTPPAKTPP